MATKSRTCSQCGSNGHNSRTCTEAGGGGSGGTGGDSPGESNGIMLFGVRVTAGGGAFRKSASMNNLSQYDHQLNQDSNAADVVADGYASDDVVHASERNRDRKRGVPWTEGEHKLFLLGLQKIGKGDWRGISRNFVKSRTPTQVASHAQKYFIRRNNHNRRRRRSSLFDITTDSVMGTGMAEDLIYSPQQQPNLSCNMNQFPILRLPCEDSMENLTLGQSNKSKNTSSSKIIRPIPIFPIPPSSKMAKLNLNETSDIETLPLSLKLSTTPTKDELSPSASASASPSPLPPSARRSSAFEAMSDNFNSNGDSIISVA